MRLSGCGDDEVWRTTGAGTDTTVELQDGGHGHGGGACTANRARCNETEVAFLPAPGYLGMEFLLHLPNPILQWLL